MHVVNQPWNGRGERFGDYLERFLRIVEPRFDVFRACVAFVRASGVIRLAPALTTFLGRGGLVEFVVGLDEEVTTRQGLELVLRYSTRAYVFNNPATTFHPKVYLFEKTGDRAVAFVGSSNLTAGGLYTNYEANVGMHLDLTKDADRQAYDRIVGVFASAADASSGNARQLDPALLQELVRTGRVADETRPARPRRLPREVAAGRLRLFPRTPVPPAPRIEPDLMDLAPRPRRTGIAELDADAATEVRPSEMFVMLLGPRDTRQEPGFSRDVYIPLTARNRHPGFWGWPHDFAPGRITASGPYEERRIDMLVRPAAGRAQLVENVRLYYYPVKHEFRLNCGRLIEGANPADVLVIQKPPMGTVFDSHIYEYEATVIPRGHPGHRTFARECTEPVGGSPKRWGYV